MAPAGSDRQVLADDLAARYGGTSRQIWATGSEPSAVPGMGSFWHLAPAFEVRDATGALLVTLVDDVTLVADLPHGGPPHPSWFRVLSDDRRLLRLAAAHIDPTTTREQALTPVADLFGTQVQHFPAASRVSDPAGATVALAAPLPAGRERPCELVTPPLLPRHNRRGPAGEDGGGGDGDAGEGHAEQLERLLGPARELGFTVPREAAVHVHVDGARFRDVPTFTDLVRLAAWWGPLLRTALGTNPSCTRLGPLPPALVDLTDQAPQVPAAAAGSSSGGDHGGWAALQRAARATGPVKWCDVNLTALLTDAPVRDTVEVRVLPGTVDGHRAAADAALVHDLLERCGRGAPLPRPSPGVLTVTDPAAARMALRALAGEAAA